VGLAPISFLGREVLSACATRAEARSYLEETQVLGGVIAVLSDRTGGTVVDVMPRGAREPGLRSIRETTGGWVAATNHSLLRGGELDSIIRYDLLVERLQEATQPGAESTSCSRRARTSDPEGFVQTPGAAGQGGCRQPCPSWQRHTVPVVKAG